jgi:hypothetical protein
MYTLAVQTELCGTAKFVPVVTPEGSATTTPYMKLKYKRSLSNMLSPKTQIYTLMIQVFWDVMLCQWLPTF